MTTKMRQKLREKPVDMLDRIKKEEFVKLYKENKGNILRTCQMAPIARQTYYTWLENDKKFLNDIIEAEAELNDEIRSILVKKATVDEDLGAVIFYLKKRHPEFKEQLPTVAVQVNSYSEIVERINDD